MNIIKKLFLAVALLSVRNTNTSMNHYDTPQYSLAAAESIFFTFPLSAGTYLMAKGVRSLSDTQYNKLNALATTGIGGYLLYKSINFYLKSYVIRHGVLPFFSMIHLNRINQAGTRYSVSLSIMNEEENRFCSLVLTSIVGVKILINNTSLLKEIRLCLTKPLFS